VNHVLDGFEDPCCPGSGLQTLLGREQPVIDLRVSQKATHDCNRSAPRQAGVGWSFRPGGDTEKGLHCIRSCT